MTNILRDKPLFEIRVSAFGVSYYLELNNISIFKEMDSFGQVSTTLPVNHWMKSGVNLIGMIIFPDEPGAAINPNAYVEMELWVKNYGDDAIGYKISSISFHGDSAGKNYISRSSPAGMFSPNESFAENANGEVEVKGIISTTTPEFEGVLIYSRELLIPSSLPRWAFFDSDDLPDYDNMPEDEYDLARNQLFIEYKKLQDALMSNDIDSVIAMIGERNREIDMAFYQAAGTTERKIQSSLENAVADNDMELAELSLDYVDIAVEDNHKLVSLVRGGDTSAIGFNFKSFSGSQSYDFVFRRQNGKWIVTR